ncbi:DUF4377 domain-containing protein [Bacteroides fluxus]|uniref:DUF4377 domain-containing protein n=1 Tax=Bacteroides fluxus TaxID=626930 RepID=UPI002A82EE68|nr:DUF4377 domain-containing protein [Bacteroides fluxus]MDY3789944.1 DUF4377 domain-containing protein [Bacteroides fluxus]
MKKIIYLLLMVLMLPLGGCSDDENEAYEGTYQLTVASEKRMVLVYPPTGGKDKVLKSCLMTKCKEIFDIDYWYPFIHPILGFEYEEGYEYVIEVNWYADKEVMDGGSYTELSKIIAKTKKTSTGLPENEK